MNDSIQGTEDATPSPGEKPQQDSDKPTPIGGVSKTHEIQIELIYGDSHKPVACNPYRVTMPDGAVVSGVLDHKGFARVCG
jgi:hypothetical protein